MKWLILSILILISANAAFAQDKNFETREMMWFGYFNQTRFTNRSGVWTDIHLRLNDEFVNEIHATLARVGYTYYFSDNARLTIGYCNQVLHGQDGAPDLSEHRPWQQIQWTEKKSWFNMMQWIRLEQRFRRKMSDGEITNDYNFNYRIRYNLSFTIPLTQKEVIPKTPFLFLNSEVFLNFGKEIVNNYFDQNRMFAGLGYQFTSHLHAHAGYMYIFQQLPEGSKYLNTHAIRLFLFHHLDLRKREN